MGVGGSFWDLLKPYARKEDVDFLRDKRVAVDLSFWIVQHETAIRRKNPRARNPHIRNTFFRTLALFSKMGAYPVFVVDGEPSPLKTKARIERFFRMSGLEPSELPKSAEDKGKATPVKQRNGLFTGCVRDCIELLRLLGMPVLEARGEAEALCAQLNIEGHVDACITADSDAFLFGAKCVIKCFNSNAKEPFECYNISDIEAGLGLGRKQMIATSLLVGNDYGLDGIPGFGINSAIRFVKLYKEDHILDRLLAIGKGTYLVNGIAELPSSNMVSTNVRSPHCSNCGHPGRKSAHLKFSCEHCVAGGSRNCMKKPSGFKCTCPDCNEACKNKEHQKNESWQLKMCKNISSQLKFPNNEIVALYLNSNHGYYDRKDGRLLKWGEPKVEELTDFLNFHQHWEPSYIRQRMLPMLSTIYLRETASTQDDSSLLLSDQYKFHSIMRVKIRYGHPYYVVKWKKDAIDTILHTVSKEQSELQQIQLLEPFESTDQLDEQDVPTVLVDDGCCYVLTDENTDLVQAAFPKEVSMFLEEKKGKLETRPDMSSSKSPGNQLSITNFYRSTKVSVPSKDSCKGQAPGDKRKKSVDLDKNLSKSVRRRLLFD